MHQLTISNIYRHPDQERKQHNDASCSVLMDAFKSCFSHPKRSGSKLHLKLKLVMSNVLPVGVNQHQYWNITIYECNMLYAKISQGQSVYIRKFFFIPQYISWDHHPLRERVCETKSASSPSTATASPDSGRQSHLNISSVISHSIYTKFGMYVTWARGNRFWVNS